MSRQHVLITIFRSMIYMVISILLIACGGGSRIVRDPQVIETTQPLASGFDNNLAVDLYWVIVQNGPGAWVKNADWDEYLFHFHNVAGEPVAVTEIVLIDYLGNRVETGSNYKKLVRDSKESEKRYKKHNLQVKAGMGTENMLLAGGATTAAGAGAIAAAVSHPFAAGAGAAAIAGIGLVLVGPVIIVGGVNKALNDSKINEEIQRRSTVLPVTLSGSGSLNMDLFYPLSPSPQEFQVKYKLAGIEHTLKIDTQEALRNLHLY